MTKYRIIKDKNDNYIPQDRVFFIWLALSPIPCRTLREAERLIEIAQHIANRGVAKEIVWKSYE